MEYFKIIPYGVSPENHLNTAALLWFFFGGIGVCLYLAYISIEKQSSLFNLEREQLERTLEIQEEKKRSFQLTIENQRAELDKLKAQINPHFLFNTLNFFYSEIRPYHKKAAESVLLLSDILRYSLIEHKDDDLVDLSDEVQYLKNYIEFQRNRFYDNFFLTFNIDWKEGSGRKKIPSMILITLVENCFKYADLKDPAQPCEIEIVVKEEAFTFETKNKVLENTFEKPSTGLGLNNIRNRLKLIYGDDKFSFNTFKKEHTFYAQLKIY
jgi:LytS/YehU family sensor histidine kinase